MPLATRLAMTVVGILLVLPAGAEVVRKHKPASMGASSATPRDGVGARTDEAGRVLRCPPGTLPDGADGANCVHPSPTDEGERAPAFRNAHHSRRGEVAYDVIPRLPDRPESYAAYLTPLDGEAGPNAGARVVSPFDLDLPDGAQRRGSGLPTGHGGLDLAAPRGAPVRLVALEHQEGDPEVLYVGPLFGTTVVTRHAVREAGGVRDYVLLHGHLQSADPSAHAGARLPASTMLGSVGDTGSPGKVHLHLEVRRIRDGVDLSVVAAGPALLRDTVSVACDPRNVLHVKTGRTAAL